MSFQVEPGKHIEYILVGKPDAQDPLEGSIEKWITIANFLKDNENAEIDDGGTGTCRLCAAYWIDNCKGCPIGIYASQWGCRGTPYELWFAHGDLASAQAMLDFLYEVKGAQ